VEIATAANLQRFEDIIRADRRVTIGAIATAIGCSHGQAYNIFRGKAFLTMTRLKERCARGSDSNHKNFTP
jgi:fructose/tagatose bisphosphate aldolase